MLRLENAVEQEHIYAYYERNILNIVLENIAVSEERWRRKENFDTARRLRKMGISDNDIHRATNISFDDLRKL